MDSTTPRVRYLPIGIAGFSISIVCLLFLWEGNKGFSLWDEGYLWYGAQRVMLGEVPLRDFLSYDPGRYYWSAALMSLWRDNGIMALRHSVAIFQAAGLFVGLLLIARSSKKLNVPYLLISAITLAVWMFPRHKLFDISVSILLIGALAFLVQNPTGRRYFLTGICVGLAAFVGRNHGVYGLLGSIGVLLWISMPHAKGAGFKRGLILWAAGVAIGFFPLLLMLLLISGFAAAFWETILFLFQVRATNLPLPIPWPWRVPVASVSFAEATRGVLVGLFFIATIVFGICAIVWVVSRKLQNQEVSPTLVAASFLSLPYAHFAYSRADVGHLAQGMFPLLIGYLVFLASRPFKIKWSLAIMLLAASAFVMLPLHPGWQCRIEKQCEVATISGSTLEVDHGTAKDVVLLRRLAAKYAPEGRSLVATPFWPGAYALLERKSPMWEIYTASPRSEAFQTRENERIRLANPGFILIIDLPLDGREEFRFRNSHPITNEFIEREFRKVDGETENPAYLLFSGAR